MFHQGEMEGDRKGSTWQFGLDYAKTVLLF